MPVKAVNNDGSATVGLPCASNGAGIQTQLMGPETPYYARALAMGIPAILLGLQITGWIFFLPAVTEGHADFRSFYSAGHMVRSGHARELYDYQRQKTLQNKVVSNEAVAMPFIHPAYEALLFVPFSLLSYRTAYITFLGFNLFLLALSYWLLQSHMEELAKIWRPLPPLMFLLFLPVTVTLMQGQDSILLLAFLAASLVFLERKKEFLAGVLLGLGLFRFQIVFPVAALFFLWRRWRFSSGFAVSAGVIGLMSLGLAGWSQTETYLRSLLSMTGSGSVADQLRYAQPAWQMANLRGLITSIGGPLLHGSWLLGTVLILSAIVFLLVARAGLKSECAGRSEIRQGLESADVTPGWTRLRLCGPTQSISGCSSSYSRIGSLLPVAIVASALVSYHLLMHDLSVLLIPIVLTLNRFIAAEGTGHKTGQRIARACVGMFVAPICISFLPFHFYLVSLPLCVSLLVMLRQLGCDEKCSSVIV
jgi:hypothetical protein